MSRLFDAVANARALLPPPGRQVPAPDTGGPAPRLGPADRELVRLWQAIETGLAGRPTRVVQIAACAEGEDDPSVAVGLARLAGAAAGRGVVVLDGTHRRVGGDGTVAFGPLPGTDGDPRALDPAALRLAWQRLSERADLVVLDSPPVTASALALALAPTVDAVVLLVEAERTREAVAAAARDALTAAGANLLGVVLTRRRFHVPKGLWDRL